MYHCALRVKLPDEPGALGAVASRIGIAGGDVLGMDVLERKAGQVVDEFLLTLKRPADAEVLRREVSSVGGVTIDEIREVGPDVHESGLSALEHVIGLLHIDDSEAFVAAVLDDLRMRTHSDGVALVGADGTISSRAGRIDVEPAAGSVSRCCAELPSIGASLVLERDTARYRERELRRVKAVAGLLEAKLRGLLA